MRPGLRARLSAVALAAVGVALAAGPDATASPEPSNPAALVNPFIGTDGNGHTFPGADMPFGMVQFSPVSVGGGPGGYEYSEQRLRGFALTRLSGAGCTNYGDVPLMPLPAPLPSSPARNSGVLVAGYSHRDEEAQPGSYQVRLDSGISVALTTTTRTGLAVFAFPPSSRSGTLAIDPSGSANAQFAAIRIVGHHEVVGSATSAAFGGPCGHPPGVYTVYFALEFDQSFAHFGDWSAGRLVPGGREQAGAHVGGYVGFDTRHGARVRAKVGVSFVSIANALGNLGAEGRSWSFTAVQRRAHASWNALLGRVRLTGGSQAEQQIFYTALYHCLLSPSVFSDANGQYIGGDGRTHTAVGYTRYANFSGWDIYRGEMQLLAMLAPHQASDMIRSLVDDGTEMGQLPRWPVANAETGLLNGDPSDVIIADAYAFGARAFDASAALREMLLGAELGQPSGPGGYVERPALADYLSRGYVPGAAAATLEYSIADFAIAQLANAVGDQADQQTMLVRSANWKKLFDPQTGYIQPRLGNGSFPGAFDPASTTGFVEGDAAQYTWLVPQDMGDLLAGLGSPSAALRRLDDFFSRLNAGPSAAHAWLGNEPSLLTPYAYLWLGLPSRTEDVVRRALTTLFTDGPNGLPGNDDLGAMSAWYVWNALGLYPAIPGVAGLAVVEPLFSRATVALGSGAIFTISTNANARYVQSLDVNGSAYDSSWVPLSAIAGGGSLDFTLGTTPSAWATAANSVPPSFPPPPQTPQP